ncbi:hypothetical protein C8A03DRAFT_33510 [Achaetomium macrosporum]|uniref:JmjC domain-containing protein n=1 Tax=Achaetomium macrosporum TaxID=79813 RepID=A0AAN7HFN0_9PEZI|nr:hypothetical protein C8A03DRAFT_33510 [Achaetomium macrosporum]
MLHASPRFCANLRLTTRRYLSTNIPKSDYQIQEFKAPVDVIAFREVAVSAKRKAVVFRKQIDTDDISSLDRDYVPTSSGKPPVFFPGLRKWFIPNHKRGFADLSPYLSKRLKDHMVPSELVLHLSDDVLDSLNKADQDSSVHTLAKFMRWLTDSGDPLYQSFRVLLELETSVDPHRPRLAGNGKSRTRFIRFNAPFALFHAALAYNKAHSGHERFADLYITQFPLSDLPKELQDDFPMPEFLAAPNPQMFNAVPDVYSSSLWLGLEPTYTPWHCDPNHNLFCQLVGCKVIRLMPPEAGLKLFREVKARLGGPANPFIRGEEMMQGPERKAFLDAVWSATPPEGMLEVELKPRDVLYLNKHWWHSVKSGADGGQLNASVNWWFQWRDRML